MSALGNRIKGWWQKAVAAVRTPQDNARAPTGRTAKRKPRRKAKK